MLLQEFGSAAIGKQIKHVQAVPLQKQVRLLWATKPLQKQIILLWATKN